MIRNLTELENICTIAESIWQLLFPQTEDERGSNLCYLFAVFHYVLNEFVFENVNISLEEGDLTSKTTQ